MKFFPYLLITIFALVGAHVSKAFSLLYLGLVISGLMSRHLDQRPLPPLPMNRSNLLRTVQALVLLFAFTYPLAMLHFGFWQLNGRQFLDLVSAVVMPPALLLWGAYWARRDLRLFTTCLLSYSLGGLVFLIAALLKTRGFSWFDPQIDAGSLLLAWGNKASMNVRSVEQNGILSVVLAPVGIFLALQRRFLACLVIFLIALLGWLAVFPLAQGRLWVVSLVISSLPIACLLILRLNARLNDGKSPPWFNFSIATIALVCLSQFLWLRRSWFCDERFAMYFGALMHWPDLLAGGRILQFEAPLCDGTTHLISLSGDASASILSMHNVPLDVMATIGFVPALPMLGFLSIAALKLIGYFVELIKRTNLFQPLPHRFLYFFLFWSFLAALIPQWLFQPLMYGDGLLYYLTYAAIGALLSLEGEDMGGVVM